MKAIFIAYNQAYYNEINDLLEAQGQRGFTQWQDIQGRGSKTGIPHYGDHAWPEMNFATMAVVEDEMIAPLMDALKAKDAETPALGLRAFVWNIEAMY